MWLYCFKLVITSIDSLQPIERATRLFLTRLPRLYFLKVERLEQENERLLEAEQQTAAELAQRLVEIANRGQAVAEQRVNQELLQVRHCCISAGSHICVAKRMCFPDKLVPIMLSRRSSVCLRNGCLAFIFTIAVIPRDHSLLVFLFAVHNTLWEGV